jgi:hypothetical protein
MGTVEREQPNSKMTDAAIIVHQITITKIYDNQPTNSHLPDINSYN